jgi:y4mF family transcriptional regulator
MTTMAKPSNTITSHGSRLISAVETANPIGRYVETKSSSPKGKVVTVSKTATALREHVAKAGAFRSSFSETTGRPVSTIVERKRIKAPTYSEARGLIEATKRAVGHEPAPRVVSARAIGAAVGQDRPDPTPIDDPSALGSLLTVRRKRLGLSQQAFADRAGVGRRFVSELEAGKPTSEIGKVLAVCRAAGLLLLAAEQDA